MNRITQAVQKIIDKRITRYPWRPTKDSNGRVFCMNDCGRVVRPFMQRKSQEQYGITLCWYCQCKVKMAVKGL